MTEDLKHTYAAYALCNESKSWIYKGSTRDLAERTHAHFTGRVTRTKNKRPLKLVYYKYFNNYTEARRHEIWLKSGQGREWLNELVKQ